MSYIGAIIIIFAAFLIWREYSHYLRGELLGCRAFHRAMEDLFDKMKCYLASPKEWAKDYKDELLSKSGMLDAVRGGEDLLTAYREAKKSICISQCVDEILESCFSRLGTGYIDTELGMIAATIEKLSKEEEKAEGELSRKSRAFGAVLGAFVSGIVILIV